MSQKEKPEFAPARAFSTVDAIRGLERKLLDESSEPGSAMERAGEAAYRWLCEQVQDANASFVVCCGSGGNGGDGLALARYLRQNGKGVEVILPKPVKHPDAKLMLERAVEAGVSILEIADIDGFEVHLDRNYEKIRKLIHGADVVVDCLLGIGSSVRKYSSPYNFLMRTINSGPALVYALDIPSGIDPETGEIGRSAVSACATLCMLAPASGLAGAGALLAGEISVADLGVQRLWLPRVCQVLESRAAPRWVERDAHKGIFGHVVIVAGDHGYGGAALLAAEAAVVGGAGLVTLCTRERHTSAVLASSPDVMVCAAEVGSDIQGALAKASAIVCGPGLGQEAWGEQMLLESLHAAKEHDIPIVLDADALNLCSALGWAENWSYLHWEQQDYIMGNEDDEWYDFFDDMLEAPLDIRDLKAVITPHPGEAARFLGREEAKSVQGDRLGAARELCQITNALVVLKGYGTIVAKSSNSDHAKGLFRTEYSEEYSSDLYVAHCGNVALARGGSGDVLAGLIGSQLAHRELGDWLYKDEDHIWKPEGPMDVVKNAVLAHGQAADELVKEHGIRGVRPRELAATAGKILSSMAYRLR